MKPAAIGMLLVIAICTIAVMDKKWNFVEPGIWLEPTPVERPSREARNAQPATPNTTQKAQNGKTSSARSKKKLPPLIAYP